MRLLDVLWVDKTVQFPDISDFNKMFWPYTFVPVATGVDGIGSFEDIIKDFECLALTDMSHTHVTFKVRFIRLADEGE